MDLLAARVFELGPVEGLASTTGSLFCSLVKMGSMTLPMWTLATVSQGFPKVPHVPV